MASILCTANGYAATIMDQREAAGVTDVAQRVTGIRSLNAFCIYLFFLMVSRVQRGNPIGLSNLIRHIQISFRELMRGLTYFREEVVEKEIIYSKMTKIAGKSNGH